MRPFLVILNPNAAAGRAVAYHEPLRRFLADAALPYELIVTATADEAVSRARVAASRYEGVVAAGGDGTVRAVATGLLQAERPCPLGVLPLGTGNDFATQIGIPTIAAAFATLAGGTVRAIDVMELRHDGSETVQYALVFAAVGFAAELLRLTTPRVKRLCGRRLSYLAGFFAAWWRFRAPELCLQTDGKTWTERFFHVGAGNAAWVGGGVMHLSPGARMDDGQLELCTIAELNRLEVLRQFPSLLRGTHPRHPQVRYFRGQALRIESDLPLTVAADGDLVGQTPVHLRVLPGRLGVYNSMVHRGGVKLAPALECPPA